MYPQTHVYFAERVLGKINDAVALGSIFPDMAIGAGVTRDLSHGSGTEILKFLEGNHQLRDFALANITHGVDPGGLDYYGDEKNPPYERGYCFEKGRILVEPTIKACNLPEEMGWWKSHNIIEMGIELRISAGGTYGRYLYEAFQNKNLVEEICERLGSFFGRGSQPFLQRLSSFPSYIDLSASTAESLAAKYDYQMYYKHRIHVNVTEVAKLISLAAEVVEDDIDEFFHSVTEKVKGLLSAHDGLNRQKTF
ncbi:MAG: hypothetical protein K6T65_09965 [Peptococcaceae bacterium]|nr:hypothetical protein [Peptococcaceae bacterium]